jgi:hypothetical protein
MQLNLAIGAPNSFVSKKWNLAVSLSAIKSKVELMQEWFLGCASNESCSHQNKVGCVDLNVSFIGDFNGGILGDDSSQFGS